MNSRPAYSIPSSYKNSAKTQEEYSVFQVSSIVLVILAPLVLVVHLVKLVPLVSLVQMVFLVHKDPVGFLVQLDLWEKLVRILIL